MKNLVILSLLCVLFSACKPVPNATDKQVITEQYRPHYHFTPPQKWMNDPNGLVFYEGEYHLFYQYYPDSTVWGPMHWGHAVSPDMVTWEHLPIALYPDSLGLIFSGSAVIDWQNTSGFGQGGKPPMVAMFTYHNMPMERAGRNDFQYQGIAYSNDRGRTWTKYAGNPVIPNPTSIRDFRDTKVIYDEARKRWLMVLAAGNHAQLWTSADLKKWTMQSKFGEGLGSHGGVWECPDFFPIVVEGSTTQKWVLLQNINPGIPNGGSGCQYFVGDFDGKTFKLDPAFEKNVQKGQAIWLDWGRDNYAGVTWADVPKSDGRRLFIGWMSNWDYAQVVPTKTWRSATTLPRSLVLRNTDSGYRLASLPVKELEKLRRKTVNLPAQTLRDTLVDITDKLGFSPAVSEAIIELEFAEGAKTDFSVLLSNAKGGRYVVGYDAAKNVFYSDRTQSGNTGFSDKFAAKIHAAPRTASGRRVQLHLFFDVASCELFADNGTLCMTEIFFPEENFDRVSIGGQSGEVKITKATWFSLE